MDKLTMFEQMEERYEKRKKAKAKYDSVIRLSAAEPDDGLCAKLAVSSNTERVRLLDEGSVVDNEGNPYLFVKKGAIERFYNALPDDYVGTISLGHFPYAKMPFVLGSWSKEDLTIIDIDNGRKAIDVNLNLDEDSIFVKEIKRQKNPLGVSVNMHYSKDKTASQALKMDVAEDIWIDEFSVVGEAGNVNSGGIELNSKGASMKDSKSFLEQMFTKFGVNKSETESEKAELSAKTEETTEETPAVEPETGTADTEEATDDNSTAETEDAAEDNTELDIAIKKMAALLDTQEKTAQLVEVLDAKLEAVTAENAELKKKLAVKDDSTEKVLSRFKELAVKFGAENTDQTKKTPDIPIWDGVGGI